MRGELCRAFDQREKAGLLRTREWRGNDSLTDVQRGRHIGDISAHQNYMFENSEKKTGAQKFRPPSILS